MEDSIPNKKQDVDFTAFLESKEGSCSIASFWRHRWESADSLRLSYRYMKQFVIWW